MYLKGYIPSIPTSVIAASTSSHQRCARFMQLFYKIINHQCNLDRFRETAQMNFRSLKLGFSAPQYVAVDSCRICHHSFLVGRCTVVVLFRPHID